MFLFSSIAYKDFVNELKKDVFGKEMQIYNLKQEIADLKCKNAELEAKGAGIETSNISVSSKMGENNLNLSAMKNFRKSIMETPIVLSSIPKLGKIFILLYCLYI